MRQHILVSVLAAAALAACGGGGGSSTDSQPAQTSTTIGGTAATGAAIAGATVQAKCASGNGSATTGVDGRFTISIEGAVRPCVLSVSAPGGMTLHSVVESGADTTAVANITPLTELIAASIGGGSASGLFASFDAAAQAKLTPTALTEVRSSVSLALTGIVDLSGIDPIKDTLVAANGSTAGNALDQKLDALGAALAKARITLAEVSSALAASLGSAASVQTILQPAAASCAGLRSGIYRALDLTSGHTELTRIDATALTVTYLSDNAVESLTAQGSCQFTIDGAEPERLLVSKSGVTVVRDEASAAQPTVTLLLPEQTLPVSELAGTWNVLIYERASAGQPYRPGAVTLTLNAAGEFKAGMDCAGISACVAWDALPGPITADSRGGFKFTEVDGNVTRVFAFKAADGQLSLYMLDNIGFAVAAKQQPLSLPAVGLVRHFWDVSIGGTGYAAAIAEIANEVTTVDAAAQRYTRQRPSDGRMDTWEINKPRPGLSYRAASTTTTNTGTVLNLAEAIGMGLPGTGVSVYTSVAATQSFFGFSVSKP
ncbi:MAG: hypothetical protein ACREYA_04520 [Cupriavidus necator]